MWKALLFSDALQLIEQTLILSKPDNTQFTMAPIKGAKSLEAHHKPDRQQCLENGIKSRTEPALVK